MTSTEPPLEECGEIAPNTNCFKHGRIPPNMAKQPACSLSSSELEFFTEGCHRFDRGAFWHAHESWEDLWNMLKARDAPSQDILLIQGLIQTAALLLHHERKNSVGIVKQWAKLHPKLEGWHHAWGLDIESHLMTVETYVNDVDQWSLVANDHQLPQA